MIDQNNNQDCVGCINCNNCLTLIKEIPRGFSPWVRM